MGREKFIADLNAPRKKWNDMMARDEKKAESDLKEFLNTGAKGATVFFIYQTVIEYKEEKKPPPPPPAEGNEVSCLPWVSKSRELYLGVQNLRILEQRDRGTSCTLLEFEFLKQGLEARAGCVRLPQTLNLSPTLTLIRATLTTRLRTTPKRCSWLLFVASFGSLPTTCRAGHTAQLAASLSCSHSWI